MEVLEPLQQLRLRIEDPENRLSADLTWTAVAPPTLEKPHFERDGSRVKENYQRFDQVGRVQGQIQVAEDDVPVEQWWACRDHSWGVRPRIGIKEPVTGPRRALEEDGFAMAFLFYSTDQHAGHLLFSGRASDEGYLSGDLRALPAGPTAGIGCRHGGGTPPRNTPLHQGHLPGSHGHRGRRTWVCIPWEPPSRCKGWATPANTRPPRPRRLARRRHRGVRRMGRPRPRHHHLPRRLQQPALAPHPTRLPHPDHNWGRNSRNGQHDADPKWQPAEVRTVTTPPLQGTKVLELAQMVAGPGAGLLLADFGASVIKVEPPAGDGARQLRSPAVAEIDPSPVFAAYNRNKSLVTADLRDEHDKAAVLRLCREADIVLTSSRPGVMERLGLGYEAISAINPRVVYAAVTGFGRGPIGQNRGGVDILVQAESGLMSTTGEAGGRRSRSASPSSTRPRPTP